MSTLKAVVIILTALSVPVGLIALAYREAKRARSNVAKFSEKSR